jgi:hypothetical protein
MRARGQSGQLITLLEKAPARHMEIWMGAIEKPYRVLM